MAALLFHSPALFSWAFRAASNRSLHKCVQISHELVQNGIVQLACTRSHRASERARISLFFFSVSLVPSVFSRIDAFRGIPELLSMSEVIEGAFARKMKALAE